MNNQNDSFWGRICAIKFYSKSQLNFAKVTLVLTFLYSQGHINAQYLQWATGEGGTGVDYQSAITLDNSGNTYATGYFSGTVDFDPSGAVFNMTSNGLKDIYVTKKDEFGNLVWAVSIGAGADDIGYDIFYDPITARIYVGGMFQSTADFDPHVSATAILSSIGGMDGFVLKLTTGGTFVDAHSIGGSNAEWVSHIKTDGNGNVYASGTFSSTVDFDPGAPVFNLSSAGTNVTFAVKYDPTLNFQWAKNLSTYSFNGFQPHGMSVSATGNVVLCSISISSPFNFVDVIKLDNTGAMVWNNSYSPYSSGDVDVQDIAMDLSGNVILTGSFTGTIDFDPHPSNTFIYSTSGVGIYVLKLNSSGNFDWVKGFISPAAGGQAQGYAVDCDDNSNIYTTGYYRGNVDFDPAAPTSTYHNSVGSKDLFIVSLSTTGDYNWSRSYGVSGGTTIGYDIEGANTTTHVTGTYNLNGVDLTPSAACGLAYGSPVHHGQTDFFLAKFSETSCCLAESDPGYATVSSNITNSTHWHNKIYIPDNTIINVSNDAVLDITNVDIVFGTCAGIEFEDGASLVANNSVFRSCGNSDTWLGLRFDSDAVLESYVNQCTFKNAEYALNFENGSRASISDNLFSNCGLGIYITSIGMSSFSLPITGNKFIVNDQYPDYTQGCWQITNPGSPIAIKAEWVNISGDLTENEVVWSYTNNARLYGFELTNASADISLNSFVNIVDPIALINASNRSSIDNNKIIYNSSIDLVGAIVPCGILIDGLCNDLVSISNNEIISGASDNFVLVGIESLNIENIKINENRIIGFPSGVVASNSANTSISGNIIEYASETGILFTQVSSPLEENYIVCNEITMENFLGIGIRVSNGNELTQVYNNCISDSETGISVSGPTSNFIPYIRNNYLYNYTLYGIYNSGHFGDIGNPSDFGQNTLWDNTNGAIDISSTSNIDVANNFGMSVIAGPINVLMNQNYHSTASCGHQIYADIEQFQLSTNLKCDLTDEINANLFIGGSSNFLVSDYVEVINSQVNKLAYLNYMLDNYSGISESLLINTLDQIDVSSNSKNYLLYEFYSERNDFLSAQMALGSIIPESEYEQKKIRLLGIHLKNLDPTNILSSNDSIFLEELLTNYTGLTNAAVSELRKHGVNARYQYPGFDAIVYDQNLKTVQISNDETLLEVYPVPSEDIVYVEYSIDSYVELNQFGIVDVSGKTIEDVTISSVGGRTQIDISSLRPGVYFIHVKTKDRIAKCAKIIKV